MNKRSIEMIYPATSGDDAKSVKPLTPSSPLGACGRVALGFVFAVAFPIVALGAGCNGEDRALEEPVAECQEYEQALSLCYHRPFEVASSPALIPHTAHERRVIGERCRQSRERIVAACR